MGESEKLRAVMDRLRQALEPLGLQPKDDIVDMTVRKLHRLHELGRRCDEAENEAARRAALIVELVGAKWRIDTALEIINAKDKENTQ